MRCSLAANTPCRAHTQRAQHVRPASATTLRQRHAGASARLDAADGLELDAAAPELAADLEVRGDRPARALRVRREDGRVVHDLLREEAEAPPRVDVLVRLAEQRVEWLARAANGARVPAARSDGCVLFVSCRVSQRWR
jgi:hypothetical protein